MAKFLIEVPHAADPEDCRLAIQTLLQTGAHFFTKADWGCKDGEHKAWLLVEVDSKNEARAIVPPSFRTQAKVVQLNAFSMADFEGGNRKAKA